MDEILSAGRAKLASMPSGGGGGGGAAAPAAGGAAPAAVEAPKEESEEEDEDVRFPFLLGAVGCRVLCTMCESIRAAG